MPRPASTKLIAASPERPRRARGRVDNVAREERPGGVARDPHVSVVRLDAQRLARGEALVRHLAAAGVVRERRLDVAGDDG